MCCPWMKKNLARVESSQKDLEAIEGAEPWTSDVVEGDGVCHTRGEGRAEG